MRSRLECVCVCWWVSWCYVAMVTRPSRRRAPSRPAVPQLRARHDEAALLHRRRGGGSQHGGRPVGVVSGQSVRPEPAGDPLRR